MNVKKQKKMKKLLDKQKSKRNSYGSSEKNICSSLSKKALAQLKSDYKKGKLKFDSKKIAEAILADFKIGITNK